MAMKPCRFLYFLIVLFFLNNNMMAQAPNDLCTNAQVLTVNGDCTNTAGDFYNSTTTAVSGTGSCGTRRDVWYRFTVPANSTYVTITVALTSATTTLTTSNVLMELFNASNCTVNGLTIGA